MLVLAGNASLAIKLKAHYVAGRAAVVHRCLEVVHRILGFSSLFKCWNGVVTRSENYAVASTMPRLEQLRHPAYELLA